MSSEWQKTTLGAICNAQGGAIQTGPFGSQLHTSDYKEVGIPVVMPTNIGDGGIVTDGIARISNEDVERLQQHKLQIDDIVFSRRGDVTKNALVRSHEVGWLCGTGCLKVRFGKQSLANAKFISYQEGNETVACLPASSTTNKALPANIDAVKQVLRGQPPQKIYCESYVLGIANHLKPKLPATRAAEEGHGELVVGEILDHTNVASARYYVEAVPTIVSRIDAAMAHRSSMGLLSQCLP